jgi:hypothetical protein
VTPADATNRLEDSSRSLAYNNETEHLTRAILELRGAILEGAEINKKTFLEGAEINKKILAVLEEDRLPRTAMQISPEPSGKKTGGRPPCDVELMLYAAFVQLGSQSGYTTDEALNSLVRQVAKQRGLPPISRETLKKKLTALRRRMPRLP